jgi:hypothetical protein
MWSIDYVQVPDETSTQREEIKQHQSPVRPNPIHHRLVKQINVSNDSSLSLMKSGSESSLSEDNNTRPALDQRESSCKEWRSEQQNEKETCSDTEDPAPPVPVRRRRSRVHGGFRKSEGT